MGLEGLECYHTKHNPATVVHYLALARQLDLLVTGGSDCHGMAKGKPTIGTVKLPYEHVERLQAKIAERRRTLSSPTPAAAVPDSAFRVPR
jgi:hypothetical protein